MSELATDAFVYRDVTFSKATRDRLAELLEWLGDEAHTPRRIAWLGSLTDVVRRWDANDATEQVWTPAGTVGPRAMDADEFLASLDDDVVPVKATPIYGSGACTCGDPGDCTQGCT